MCGRQIDAPNRRAIQIRMELLSNNPIVSHDTHTQNRVVGSESLRVLAHEYNRRLLTKES